MASRFCSGDESGVFKGQAGTYASLYKFYGEIVDAISHIWLGSLSERMEKEKMIRLIECAEKLTGKAEREFADSVLEVSIGANKQVIEELLGDERMCQALMEIMEPHLQLREKAGMKEGIKEGINGAVDTLRAFGHGDLEIKNAIMQRYVLSEEEAEEYVYGRNEKAER
ncbi:MAG: hypothetical protein K2P66_14050 [Lachnospiraceae bacterium]|nr:hypothetical protein [Lachnospiraceae bacterium]